MRLKEGLFAAAMLVSLAGCNQTRPEMEPDRHRVPLDAGAQTEPERLRADGALETTEDEEVLKDLSIERTRAEIIDEYDRLIRANLEKGVVESIDATNNRIWVDAQIWRHMTRDAKIDMVNTFSQYFYLIRNSAEVTALRAHDATVLAEYSDDAGIRIYH